ncbi:DUF1120 domain-containing protein [Pseudomonas khavaziana]|uniref:hypothetical protein n=1 Tax=Pseudomonas khavaziana TaxID=2842351 RepID=UPI001C3E5C34|nr:hypothetical protein [Pseudomonas khavaziana]MBV4479503.1 hypothetical protein [Pseudomonas khavaziana]
MKINFTKLPRRFAVPGKPNGPFAPGYLAGGLSLYLLFGAFALNAAYASECRVSLSQPTVDYGVIRRAELWGEQSGRPRFSLGNRTFRLSVACADVTAMAMRITGVPAEAGAFRFGREGHFTLQLQQAQVDGQNVQMRAVHQFDESANGRLYPGVVLCAQAGGAPVSGRRFTALVNIEAYMPASGMAVGNETSLEGRGTFERVPCA